MVCTYFGPQGRFMDVVNYDMEIVGVTVAVELVGLHLKGAAER